MYVMYICIHKSTIPTITKKLRSSWHFLYVAWYTINCASCVLYCPASLCSEIKRLHVVACDVSRKVSREYVKKKFLCIFTMGYTKAFKSSFFLPGLLIMEGQIVFFAVTVHWGCPDDGAKLPLRVRRLLPYCAIQWTIFPFQAKPASLGGVILPNGAETFTRTSTPENTPESDVQTA